MKVHCVQCDGENIVDFDKLKNLEFIKCSSCGEYFNLFGLYWSLYEKIPLCKKMVDIFVQNLYSNYVIELESSNNVKDVDQIRKILLNNSFCEQLKQIIFDTVLYGNSFLHVNKTLNLIRLEPSKLEILIDWVQRKPARGFYPEIVKINEFNKSSKKYNFKDILHFIGESSISGPIGDSICGFWFDSWYIVRDAPIPLLLMKSNGVDVSSFENFRDFEESGIMGAAGIPYKLIFPWYQIDPSVDQREQQRFLDEIKRRRHQISRVLEREYFPKILKKKFSTDNFPRFLFT